ncbi:MlaD family protein [Tepidicaulis sp. LMO-SS28]|uniref:MlaD family protein n=1 Tax=Tepidicaulis sp. LMO-SS28 TaxID=3447455 RepID=UPI003EE1D3A5
MEIKSNNVLIGTFALAGLLAIFLFALWIGRFQVDRTYSYYEIVFEGSVSGLTKGGTVQYNGIQVGRVIDLRLAKNDPSKVITLVELDARAPVKEDTLAMLQLSGLTGVALIELSGGSPDSPPLRPKDGRTYAVIESKKSTIQQIATTAPQVIDNTNELLGDLRKLVAQNETHVSNVIGNLDTVSKELADSTAELDQTLQHVTKISANLDRITANADEIIATDGKALVKEAREAAAAYRRIGEEFEGVVAGNRDSINRFTREGLGEVPQLVAEMRELVRNIDRLTLKVEDNPGNFLLGRDVPEYQGAE